MQQCRSYFTVKNSKIQLHQKKNLKERENIDSITIWTLDNHILIGDWKLCIQYCPWPICHFGCLSSFVIIATNCGMQYDDNLRPFFKLLCLWYYIKCRYFWKAFFWGLKGPTFRRDELCYSVKRHKRDTRVLFAHTFVEKVIFWGKSVGDPLDSLPNLCEMGYWQQ